MNSLASGTVHLILGGARSGKSWWAERLAAGTGRPVIYLATAAGEDAEMAARIAAHRAARPTEWRTIEAPDRLARVIRDHARPGDVVLIDCLTLWVSNVILARVAGTPDVDAVPAEVWSAIEEDLLAAAADLVAVARATGVTLILVSNEVGMGIVPAFPLGRRYRDALGRVNRSVARHAEAVTLMIAGLPVDVRRLVPDEFRALLE